MDANDVVQHLQQFIIDHGLPRIDVALFGFKCPYCGKSDRIRQLEEPEKLDGEIEPEDVRKYADFWASLTQAKGSLGVCKFCHNPLKIVLNEGRAEALYK